MLLRTTTSFDDTASQVWTLRLIGRTVIAPLQRMRQRAEVRAAYEDLTPELLDDIGLTPDRLSELERLEPRPRPLTPRREKRSARVHGGAGMVVRLRPLR